MTPEQLKLADKIEAWSLEKWKPLTLIAHERRLAVAALRATPDARVKEALQALYEWYDRDGSVGGASEIFEDNRDALSRQPGTGEAGDVPDRETFWLVERIGHQQYVKDHSELPALTNDPWRAVRFVTEREAHNFWLRLATLRDECKPVEHMFINKGAPSPALDTATVEAVAKSLQNFWQQPTGRSWDAPGDEKSCCQALPGQADWFRKLAITAIRALTAKEGA